MPRIETPEEIWDAAIYGEPPPLEATRGEVRFSFWFGVLIGVFYNVILRWAGGLF